MGCDILKVLITAGGTGGHIYPAIAIIDKIKKMDASATFLYIGTKNRMEKDIIPNLNIEYIGIDMVGLDKNPIHCLKFGLNLLSGIKKCKKIILNFQPDIVIGVGGYVTAPVIYSASKLNVPILIHEQNSVPGKANKFLSKYANKICVSMKSSIDYFPKEKVIYTGNPRSEEIISIPKGNKKDFGLTPAKKLVLITTGSLGASTINDMIMNLIPKVDKKNYEILLVTGKNSFDDIKNKKCPNNVKIVPYIENMAGILKNTDLIISRAGASTISEISALGIPSILIPSPYVANNHQYLNAIYLKNNDACYLIEEKDLNDKIVLDTIDKILNDKEEYKKISENAKRLGITDSSTRIYKEIKKLIKQGENNE